jgi:hypothetical protein
MCLVPFPWESQYKDFPGILLLKSLYHFNEGGFTRPVRTEKGKKFPFLDAEVYAVNCPDIPEVLSYLADLYYGFLIQTKIFTGSNERKTFQ